MIKKLSAFYAPVFILIFTMLLMFSELLSIILYKETLKWMLKICDAKTPLLVFQFCCNLWKRQLQSALSQPTVLDETNSTQKILWNVLNISAGYLTFFEEHCFVCLTTIDIFGLQPFFRIHKCAIQYFPNCDMSPKKSHV